MTDISKAEKLARAMDNVRSGGLSFNGGLAAQVSHELRGLAAERDALRAQNIELQSALAETEAQAQTERDDATPLSEATCVMQKRIGSTPFPEGLQAIADDAHVLIARQAFRITQLEKVAMRPTP